MILNVDMSGKQAIAYTWSYPDEVVIKAWATIYYRPRRVYRNWGCPEIRATRAAQPIPEVKLK